VKTIRTWPRLSWHNIVLGNRSGFAVGSWRRAAVRLGEGGSRGLRPRRLRSHGRAPKTNARNRCHHSVLLDCTARSPRGGGPGRLRPCRSHLRAPKTRKRHSCYRRTWECIEIRWPVCGTREPTHKGFPGVRRQMENGFCRTPHRMGTEHGEENFPVAGGMDDYCDVRKIVRELPGQAHSAGSLDSLMSGSLGLLWPFRVAAAFYVL
jgi:hypothetical protein